MNSPHGSMIGAIASRHLAERLDRLVGPLRTCTSPRDLPAMHGRDAARLVIYEAGAFPREAADQWLGAFCTVPNLPPVIVCWSNGTEALRESARMMSVTPCLLASAELNLGPVIMRSLARQRSGDVIRVALQHIEAASARRCDPITMAALAIGDARRAVTDLANVTGTGVRALSHRCRVTGLPRPVTLLGWSRALHVVAAMEWDGESLHEVAARTGEVSSRDCADHIRYHTGRAPTSWLRAGGVEAVLDEFTERFAHKITRDHASPSLFLVSSSRMFAAVS